MTAFKDTIRAENPRPVDTAGVTDVPTVRRDGVVRAVNLREGIIDIPGGLRLHHGARLEAARLGWRMTGPAAAPIVVVLGGISGHRTVFTLDPARIGWWSEVVGPDLALPTDQLQILAFDYLGGSGETTGPSNGEWFPAVSTYDQAELLLRLLDHLGIKKLHAIVGASYGGMVAMAFAQRYRERVSRLLVVSAADRAHPMATAWRSLQRRIVRLGLDSSRPEAGLELARALAMTTYRSPNEFAARFSGAAHEIDGRFVFPVEEYLLARGEDYAKRYQPDGFLILSESIDLHRIDATQVNVPVTAIAVREDQLVPTADMRALCARLPQAELLEMSSIYGHDAFLKECSQLKNLFAAPLGLVRGAEGTP
ncbi:MAG: homoserine O-succinyltransferase [Gammaproteobacteria bacterium]|nr:homoserine O-succinyltransferase [Gammaproteobacteria bacterium]MBM4209900.1 homoserine O-succinyltransferase [Gammaproteobacteria bacterium]MBM4230575.1 homoserine O-succinyltransferase [Gammaproteobacteria bacterium]